MCSLSLYCKAMFIIFVNKMSSWIIGTWHNVNDLKQNLFWLNFCNLKFFLVILHQPFFFCCWEIFFFFCLFFRSFLFYKYQRVTKQVPTAVKKMNHFLFFFFFFFSFLFFLWFGLFSALLVFSASLFKELFVFFFRESVELRPLPRFSGYRRCRLLPLWGQAFW